MTVWLDATFEVDPEPPFRPVGVIGPDGIQLTIRSTFKLAGRVRRRSDLGRRWDDLLQAGAVDVPGIGQHDLRPDKWFACSLPATGTAEDIESALADAAGHLLEFLGPFFALSTDAS